MKVVLILSGGVDSTTLLYDLVSKNFDIHAIGFDYNQKHSNELNYARLSCEKLNVPFRKLDLDILGSIAPSALTRDDIDVPEGNYQDYNMKETVVPNRNMVFISLAVSYAIGIGATRIFYGAHGGDHVIYPDCRPKFVEKMNEVVKICDWSDIDLVAPYLYLTKGQIIKIGKELNVDYSLTWTCYKGKEKACGKCGSCIERLEAFEFAGIVDSLEYIT
jgi:7-cyano-7-deazaguanine synthase